MASPHETRASDFIIGPIASGSGGNAGKVPMFVAATSTVAGSVDLSTIPGLPDSIVGVLSGAAAAANPLQAQQPNVLGHYITIQAEGADLYWVLGPTSASVTGANVPLPTAVGTNVIQLCAYLPAGQERPVLLFKGQQSGLLSPCRFLGFVNKAGSGFVRIFLSDGIIGGNV